LCCSETIRAARIAKRTSERTAKPSRDVSEAQWFAVSAYRERQRNRGGLIAAQQKWLDPPSQIVQLSVERLR
jgi:hypothetical protein